MRVRACAEWRWWWWWWAGLEFARWTSFGAADTEPACPTQLANPCEAMPSHASPCAQVSQGKKGTNLRRFQSERRRLDRWYCLTRTTGLAFGAARRGLEAFQWIAQKHYRTISRPSPSPPLLLASSRTRLDLHRNRHLSLLLCAFLLLLLLLQRIGTPAVQSARALPRIHHAPTHKQPHTPHAHTRTTRYHPRPASPRLSISSFPAVTPA